MASTELSLPYYLTNKPVINLSNKINEGVIVNDNNNNLTGEKIKYLSKFLNIEENKPANSLIYINNSSNFGAFAFPEISEENQNNESFILTTKTQHDEGGKGLGWKWTNILDLPLTKYKTVNIHISNTNNIITITKETNELFFNENYNYIGIFDLYIKLDPIIISNYIKLNQRLCLAIKKDDYNNILSIYDILDITTTTNNYINKVKIINNIISPTNSLNEISLKYTCFVIDNNNYINFSKKDTINVTNEINDISSLGLEIYGTLTILEFKK